MMHALFAKAAISLAASVSIAATSLVSHTPFNDVNAIFAAAHRVLDRDVVVVGGGATGSYAAYRLQQDHHKSVLLVEKNDHLNGQVSSHADSNTNIAVNYNMQAYNHNSPARAFLDRLQIPINSPVQVPLTKYYIDYTTGSIISDYKAPIETDQIAAFERYVQICEQYKHIIHSGVAKYIARNEIPQDLLLNFGEFVERYDLHAAVPQILEGSGLDLPQVSKQLTIWVMQSYGMHIVQNNIWKIPRIAPASHRNAEMNEKLHNTLGEANVMLSSAVIASVRKRNNVTLLIKSRNGILTAVRTKRLLIAFNPTLETLAPLFPDEKELSVFEKLTYQTVHAGVITHPSLPVNGSFVNIPTKAMQADYLGLPFSAFFKSFDSTGKPNNAYSVVLTGNSDFTIIEAQKLVCEVVQKMMQVGTIPFSDEKVRFLEWNVNSGMHFNPECAELEEELLGKPNKLQVSKRTWFIDHGVSAHSLDIGWANVDAVLPQVVDGL